MSDFLKEKIAYVIGMLAVLFTLTPLIDAHSNLGFSLFGVLIQLRHLYNVMAVSLGLGAYTYGIQFVTERRLKLTTITGDVFYAFAIVAPGLFAGLWIAAAIGNQAAEIARSPLFSSVVQTSLSVATGVAGAVAGFGFRRVLDLKQRKVEASRQSHAELSALRRAEELYEAGHFDLAVVEAFRALEVAARSLPREPGRKGNAQRDWMEPLLDRVPSELRRSIDEVRRIRNTAAHTTTPVSQSAAKEALGATNKVLAILSDIHTERCPRCGKTGLLVEEGSDHGYRWERRRCPHCGFVELD